MGRVEAIFGDKYHKKGAFNLRYELIFFTLHRVM